MSHRIAMLSYHTCPLASQEGKETGGMNVYVLELSQQLAALGYEVDIYTRCQDPNNQEIVEIAKGLKLYHIPAGPSKSVPKKELAAFIPEFVENVMGVMQRDKLRYDVFHGHYYLSGLVALELKSKLKTDIPLVMTFHTLALMKNLVGRDEQEKEEHFRITAEHTLIEKSELIIAASESDKKYLEYLYDAPAQKVMAVPPGVNTKLFTHISKAEAKKKIGAKPNDNILLFVGRIEPLKGIDALMFAVKILLKRQPSLPVCLWIVGGDVSQHKSLWSKELRKLEQLRKTLKLQTVVNFEGQQTQDLLPYYYNAAEVVVMPSHYESFGMAALEAMACGVPVITTNVAGVTTIFDERHNHMVTTVNNPLLLATQIEQLLIDKERHQQTSQEIAARVQDLDWHKIAKKVGALYDKL